VDSCNETGIKANRPSQQKPTDINKSCWTIKANKFHHKVDLKHRIEFKGLITTAKSAPEQTKIGHVVGKFW